MYKIIYKDGSEFLGGEPKRSLWNDIDKPINQIEYMLGNKTIIMRGYEMYNHIIEEGDICQGGKILVKKVLLYVVIMGLSGELVTGIVFNLRKKRMEKFKRTLGREWNFGLTTGWKKGISNLKPELFY